MTYPESGEEGRQKLQGFYEFARAVTVYGTLTFLVLSALYLVIHAFGSGFYVGSRSFAGALFPIIIGSFIYLTRRESLQRIGSMPYTVGFLSGVIVGALIMIVLKRFGDGSVIPIAELVVSGCFSVLVFSSAAASGDKPLSLYFGVMSGLLLYIILIGFPLVT